MAGAVGARGELESVRVTRILRDDIILGRRAPGSRLVERDIAAELHVSRLPVREAIRTLVAEGVVVARPRTWAVVREFTYRDIRDFAEVREAIETLIFVFAAERHDESGIARLRDAYERELAAALVDDSETARIAAAEFHEIAVELAGNEMLAELIAVFLTRLRWLFGQHDDLVAMADEHRIILDAVIARDADALRRIVPAHLASGQSAAERRLAGDGDLVI
ncbi:GntR family transcriptional regulator [Microbacterium algeriense]|uniref:GntR family transcriptional regulator n=1 Tax=Microbacterium algeriense TaxID=2615184 RepID=A0ABQ6V386_9MICO|nr:GntR family transcriptional regulator [Microbacterium algeriense]KAB1862410.1 GntR family transcriptional regulator [Microbacterium algeriense]MDX2399424.1 GntR family transcriptional regulator [Microbacterium algeriense]